MTDNIKQIQQNRVFGKDWQFSGESKNFPQLLDIRYEKDYKLSLKSKKLNPTATTGRMISAHGLRKKVLGDTSESSTSAETQTAV